MTSENSANEYFLCYRMHAVLQEISSLAECNKDVTGLDSRVDLPVCCIAQKCAWMFFLNLVAVVFAV